MRIVSKKKDYYDCIQSYAQDRSVVYVREPIETCFEKEFKCLPRFTIDRGHPYLVGFCGKVYPLVVFFTGSTLDTFKHHNCYSIDDVDEFVSKNFNKNALNEYQTGKSRGGTKKRWRCQKPVRSEYEQWFNEVRKHTDKFLHLFQEKRSPVFVADMGSGYKGYRTVFNDLLNQYEFFKVFGPHEAFQNIFMFMSNLAVPQKDMPVISDELKILTHGFTKDSFRSSGGR